MKLIIVAVSVLFSMAQLAPRMTPGVLTIGDIAVAVGALPRFPPDRFVALPPSVREAFVAMNCQVPQTNLSSGPHNVVEGEFAANGQRDWAALCSNGTITEIRVVWGGPVQCEDRLAPRQDSDSLVATAPGYYSYGRSLSVAANGDRDALDDVVSNGPRTRYACISGHWQPIR